MQVQDQNGQTLWFWQVDLTAAAQELLASITPKGCVFKWKVMPFGVANAPALFRELMNKILYISSVNFSLSVKKVISESNSKNVSL